MLSSPEIKQNSLPQLSTLKYNYPMPTYIPPSGQFRINNNQHRIQYNFPMPAYIPPSNQFRNNYQQRNTQIINENIINPPNIGDNSSNPQSIHSNLQRNFQHQPNVHPYPHHQIPLVIPSRIIPEIVPNNHIQPNIKNNNNMSELLEEVNVTEKILEKKEQEECAICLGDFELNEKICYLPCFHFFHAECIKDYIKKKPICPICNHKVQL